MAQVQIIPSVLKQQVEEGMKLKALAEHYELPEAQMKKALKSLGLQIRKFHAPKFVFVEEPVLASEETFVNEILVEDFQEIIPEPTDAEEFAESVVLPQDTWDGEVVQENW